MNKKRTWISAGAASLCLLLVVSLPADTARSLKMAVTQFFRPLLSVSTAARRSLTPSAPAPAATDRLLEELRQENARLREMLGYAPRAQWKLRAARVIGRDASNWWKTIVLDRGSADGVRENMALVTPAGLVGKTIEIGPRVSRALLISDPNCKVSALLQESRDHGVVEGVGASSDARPRCVLLYLPREATVNAGAWVVASGLGGVFPKGVVIGQIESISSGGLQQSAVIKPAVNLARLEEVFIVMGEK